MRVCKVQLGAHSSGAVTRKLASRESSSPLVGGVVRLKQVLQAHNEGVGQVPANWSRGTLRVRLSCPSRQIGCSCRCSSGGGSGGGSEWTFHTYQTRQACEPSLPPVAAGRHQAVVRLQQATASAACLPTPRATACKAHLSFQAATSLPCGLSRRWASSSARGVSTRCRPCRKVTWGGMAGNARVSTRPRHDGCSVATVSPPSACHCRKVTWEQDVFLQMRATWSVGKRAKCAAGPCSRRQQGRTCTAPGTHRSGTSRCTHQVGGGVLQQRALHLGGHQLNVGTVRLRRRKKHPLELMQ